MLNFDELFIETLITKLMRCCGNNLLSARLRQRQIIEQADIPEPYSRPVAASAGTVHV